MNFFCQKELSSRKQSRNKGSVSCITNLSLFITTSLQPLSGEAVSGTNQSSPRLNAYLEGDVEILSEDAPVSFCHLIQLQRGKQ
jgi:hypothetical protein